MNNNLNELIEQVHEICGAWGMYEEGQSSELKQLLYAAGEAGELAIAIAKNDIEGIKDGIGDTFVCLINAAKLKGSIDGKMALSRGRDFIAIGTLIGSIGELIRYANFKTGTTIHDYDNSTISLCLLANHFNLTIEECLQQAINEISKRTGKFVNGVFVKDQK